MPLCILRSHALTDVGSWAMRGVTLVFAGLAAAAAAVIDDAAIDVNRGRPRLDERRREGRRVSAAAVVLEGATEMRSAMGYAAAIIVLPVPALFIEGITGAFVAPLVRSSLIAIAASMLVALIVKPARRSLPGSREV